MEKHKCKLCFRSFNNGRALGGHMRSHVMNLAKQEDESSRTIQLSFEAESSPSFSSSSSSSSEEDEDHNDNNNVKDVCYVLNDNPKRNITEFSGSVILQDRESETESSKNNPTRKRSKRAWKIRRCNHTITNNTIEPLVDHEPVNSVSDTTTEEDIEDVAFCLMLLSRDKWKPQKDEQEEAEEADQAERSLEDCYESHQDIMKEPNNNRLRKGRYKCETCNKVFRSYQALGGHRASHKKIKVNIKVDHEPEFEVEKMVEKKIHECPVCLRVFASGQALGGHKRTHVSGSSTTTVPVFSSSKRFIDLNLPAPIDYDDDDDISQIENSAVSDAEFVKNR